MNASGNNVRYKAVIVPMTQFVTVDEDTKRIVTFDLKEIFDIFIKRHTDPIKEIKDENEKIRYIETLEAREDEFFSLVKELENSLSRPGQLLFLTYITCHKDFYKHNMSLDMERKLRDFSTVDFAEIENSYIKRCRLAKLEPQLDELKQYDTVSRLVQQQRQQQQ